MFEWLQSFGGDLVWVAGLFVALASIARNVTDAGRWLYKATREAYLERRDRRVAVARVLQSAEQWDEAAADARIATDERRRIADDVAEIRRQVTIDGGYSLKDHVVGLRAEMEEARRRGTARHAQLDRRFTAVEQHLQTHHEFAVEHHRDEPAADPADDQD